MPNKPAREYGALRARFEDATISATSVDQIDADSLKSILDEFDFAVIRELISPEEIRVARQALENKFSVADDNPATGEDPKVLFENYQKFSIGGGELREKDLAKCVRTFYNPLFAPDIYRMQDVFRRCAQVRNIILDVDRDFAIERPQDGFWTAARIHHYPTGGGFMQGHVDDYIPTLYKGTNLSSYFQPLIVMSKRGTSDDCDYSQGGGYFCIDDDRIYYEAMVELGTILIYNTNTYHGVTDIDPHKPFHQASLHGRYSGFVTLYRDLSKSLTLG